MRRACGRAWPIAAWGAVLALCCQLALVPILARAAGPSIATFYPATKADYDRWYASTSTAPPPRTTAFPSGTTIVTFYFEFAGTTANTTQFEVVVRDRAGASVATHGPYTLALGAGLHMSQVSAPAGRPYPDGSYTAQLLVDGHADATTSFTIGGPPLASVSFYAATSLAYDAWNVTAGLRAPPPSVSFPRGTRVVAFYSRYRGATPGSTARAIVIHAPSGATYATAGSTILQRADGDEMVEIAAPGGGYPGGTYHATVTLGGRVAGSADFTVRGSSGATVSTFYTATKAGYDAWNVGAGAGHPLRTRGFEPGTTIVAFFFQYRGAIARSTSYELRVRSRSGALVAGAGPFTCASSAARAMRYVTLPGGAAFHDDAYRGELVVDGRVAATTSFAVGSVHAARVGTFYAATNAAYGAWVASTSTAAPPRTSNFGARSTVIALYFAYAGAVPHATRYEYLIYGRANRLVATHGPYTVPYSAGFQMSRIARPRTKAFARGFYRADLLIDGGVTNSTWFTVGAPGATTDASCSATTCASQSVLRLRADLPNHSSANGTAFVVQSDRTGTYLLTNKHVVDGVSPDGLQAISADGHTYYSVEAIAMSDAPQGSAGDLAVVKLGPTGLRPLDWSDTHRLSAAQRVTSLGYPSLAEAPGPPDAAAERIVSPGTDLGDGYGPIWIQYAGGARADDSGAPLLDGQNAVVGIDTLAGRAAGGANYAIPAAGARIIAQQLIKVTSGE